MTRETAMLGELTTVQLRALTDAPEPLVALVPVGCVEPHGPHLPLDTDTVLSEAVCERAVPGLREEGWRPLIAPSVGYGVTECGAAFAGTVSISPDTLEAFLDDVVAGLLDDGIEHVCLVNNHLEPGHDRTVRSMIEHFDEADISVATPMKPKWGRTLSEEFKRGECHAGRYETSMMLAIDPDRVDREAMAELPENPVSLSENLQEGVMDFKEMGLAHAYAGAPADSTAEHGDEMLDRLAEMVVSEVTETRSSD